MKDKLYTISELTKILNLHSKTILRFIHEGKIKGKKIGRSWMISESDLRTYVHGDNPPTEEIKDEVDYSSIKKRITVSAVIEIIEENSEEASRISNSLMAMLNCDNDFTNKTRFDFVYYPESQKAKYIIYGTPKRVREIISFFEILTNQGDK